MTHLTRCQCAECDQLDRLPVRRQGIPGAFQLTFDNAHHAGIDWPEVEPHSGKGPRARYAPDDLPLFVAANEPRLL